jgi:hypothetical protein
VSILEKTRVIAPGNRTIAGEMLAFGREAKDSDDVVEL